jgi:hypothetical protein
MSNKNQNKGADLQKGADGVQNANTNQQGDDGVQNGNENTNQQGADGAQNGDENAAAEQKKSKSKWADKAAKIFKQYPVSKELHFTSDGTAFFQASDAANYANGLADKTVEKVTR